MAKNESFHNLIDICIQLEEDPQFTGNTAEIFRKILSDYFFKQETFENKKMENFFKAFPMPDFLKNHSSLLEIDIEDLRAYVESENLKDSISGKIFLSSDYLKSFYPHHAPSFNKMPSDVQQELLQKVKSRNQQIIESCEKMLADRAADKSRRIITLVALILRNIHLRTAIPFNRLERPSEDIIRGIIGNCDEVFRGQKKQLVDLSDDMKIKDLIKLFFTAKTFQDITGLAAIFKEEIERFRKRALRA
jgi:hypothetical protein